MLTYNLLIFLTSTLHYGYKHNIRHTSFEIYRFLAKLSFKVRP